jgi:hypothetical protein
MDMLPFFRVLGCFYDDMRQMPWGDVTGEGSGSKRRPCNHSVCLFELWSQEISGSRTSAYYRETLIRAHDKTETAQVR